MDENTQMMIQMASMLMQNQSAIQETQSQLHTATADDSVVVQTTPGNNAKVVADDSLKATEADAASSPAFGMDPKLMAEFARQIVMNAAAKRTPDKPTTIAQIMQSQSLLNAKVASLMANQTKNNNDNKSVNNNVPNTSSSNQSASSEGKIFVYNQLPEIDDSPGAATSAVDIKPVLPGLPSATNGHFPQHVHVNRRQSAIGPIRNRYGRVLRPGIDNFGRFEAVANHGLIMHAMELLRQKDKKKRGPKEKDTFAVFMYCLPDKNSKLPKFSSLDPIERALVDQHQQEGYGEAKTGGGDIRRV